jgi:tRNA-Thr(GGU) m(6)t(6)A37 methyltransferase TsaA
MTDATTYELVPIGWVRSSLKQRGDAPKQGYEGAPDARIQIEARFGPALDRLAPGDDLLVLTWLHQGRRDVLAVHPRRDLSKPLHGVFATRSPDRPNPIGLHRVRLLAVESGSVLHVAPLEAIDGTPVVDIKPALEAAGGW